MTHFQESAVRDSAEHTSGITQPYLLRNNQISALMQANIVGSGLRPLPNQHYVTSSALPDFSTEPMGMASGSDMLNTYRPIPYSHFNDFAPTAFQNSSQRVGRSPSLESSSDQLSPRTSIRTTTGPRVMKRSGLAGASAFINGQYCCHWTVQGMKCGRLFADAKQLNDHIKTDHVRGARGFTCHWHGCDNNSFATANKLVRHVHSHTGHKPFQCQSCFQSFVTKDQLDKHSTTHTGAKDFVCQWDGCGRSFAVKHALDGHVNSVHLKAKKHTCPHCNQAFDDSSNLSKHKKQVHNPETGIKCPARHSHNCEYVDSRRDKMREHCERENHGLAIVNDAHRWNLWVQQFKSAGRKSECRRHHRHVCASSLSRASSVSTSTYTSMQLAEVVPIECNKQDCDLPVCLPCNLLCPDLHSVALHHSLVQPCNEPDCEEEESCQPCEPCEPCEPCDDTECDPYTRQPCNVQPCSISHCRSFSSTPPRPLSPYYNHDNVTSDTYFDLPGFPGSETDPFQDMDSAFQLG